MTAQRIAWMAYWQKRAKRWGYAHAFLVVDGHVETRARCGAKSSAEKKIVDSASEDGFHRCSDCLRVEVRPKKTDGFEPTHTFEDWEMEKP